jgi:RecJ-like exonuclease
MPEFVVSSVKYVPKNLELCTLIGSVPVQIYSRALAEPLDIVELSASDVLSQLDAKHITGRKATSEEYERLMSNALKALPETRPVQKFGIKPLDEAFSAMGPKLGQVAERIVRKFVSGAPIIFRFHNDGDGASGAVAIYKALDKLGKEIRLSSHNCIWTMNKGVAYTMQSLSYDQLRLSQFHSVEKPLLCIIDFGTLDESIPVIKKASEYMDIVWLDHHPTYDGFDYGEALYVNPWLEGYGSDVSAGAMACAVASKIANAKVKDLAKASLLSDHSSYAKEEPETLKLAVILDAITTDSSSRSSNVNPKSIIASIEDESVSRSIFSEAKSQMDEAIITGMQHLKVHRHAGFVIAVLDYSRVSDSAYNFVRHGRFTSIFSDSVEEKFGPSVTIVHNRGLASIRASKILSKRLSLLSIIEKMKGDTDYILNGGGHNEAASVKLEDEYLTEEFLKLLEKEICINLGD